MGEGDVPMSDWKKEAIERDRKFLARRGEENLRRLPNPSENRARTRTAKEALAARFDALRGPTDIPLPDADDSSIRTILR